MQAPSTPNDPWPPAGGAGGQDGDGGGAAPGWVQFGGGDAFSPAGSADKSHSHGGGELTLVLRGSYTDEIGRFRNGDLADLDPSVDHTPVADTDEPCICLIATDQRLRFSGVFSRMLQPLIGI